MRVRVVPHFALFLARLIALSSINTKRGRTYVVASVCARERGVEGGGDIDIQRDSPSPLFYPILFLPSSLPFSPTSPSLPSSPSPLSSPSSPSLLSFLSLLSLSPHPFSPSLPSSLLPSLFLGFVASHCVFEDLHLSISFISRG